MRYVPVEEARKQLGKLIQEARAGEPIIIARRGTEQAVLMSGEEYARLRAIEEETARARFAAALEAIGHEVRRRRLPRTVVDEAVRKTRRR